MRATIIPSRVAEGAAPGGVRSADVTLRDYPVAVAARRFTRAVQDLHRRGSCGGDGAFIFNTRG